MASQHSTNDKIKVQINDRITKKLNDLEDNIQEIQQNFDVLVDKIKIFLFPLNSTEVSPEISPEACDQDKRSPLIERLDKNIDQIHDIAYYIKEISDKVDV